MSLKTGLEKLEETERGWETNAAEDKFYGLTLAQFKTKVQLSRDANNVVLNLKAQLETAKNTFDTITKENLAIEKNIAKSIAGDPNHGDDSTLYESTGRVRRSERKTGLHRTKKPRDEDK